MEGSYLDALGCAEASTGSGQARRNRSIMEQPMILGGESFPCGLGAHAVSRIGYRVPEGLSAFAGIGKDHEVAGGSVVFVIEAAGQQVFRNAVFWNDTPVREISIPIEGVKRLVLVVEDAGDGIAADHADWADARFLR